MTVRSLAGAVLGPLLGAFLAMSWTAHAAEGDKADVVLRNGKIYTADPSRSIRQAIAFTGNTIVAVGADADMEKLTGPSTKVTDLGGKLVLPGLMDTHVHPIIGAIDRSKCSLEGVKATIATLKPVLRGCIEKAPGGPDEWFEAVQLDNYGFSATAKDLDEIEADRPMALGGNDGHTVWVNSKGLALLGVTAETPDPAGGKIARDASGAPTGSFTDAAATIVTDKMPAPSLDERANWTAGVLKDMSAHGITSLLDAYVTPGELAVWRKLYDEGRLSMRVRMANYVADPSSLLRPAANASDDAIARLVSVAKKGDIDPDFLRSSLIKIFADGVIEYPAQTAAMLSPISTPRASPRNIWVSSISIRGTLPSSSPSSTRKELPCMCMRSATAACARRLTPLPPPGPRTATRTTDTRSRISRSSIRLTSRASRNLA